jgi:hypothetical protein
MSTWSFYDMKTGVLIGRTFTADTDAMLAANTPAGHGAVEGAHDHMSKRVNLKTGKVVDWQPPAPKDDDMQTWAWDAEAKRWVSAPTAKAEALRQREALTAEIVRLEQGQARALRELALATDNGTRGAALNRLRDIEARAAEIRGRML